MKLNKREQNLLFQLQLGIVVITVIWLLIKILK